MSYLCTSGIFVILCLLLPRSKKSQNLLVSLPIAIIAYEGYLCLIAGLMTMFHIPVSNNSISIINLVCIAGMVFFFIKKRQFQSYIVKTLDVVFLLLLAAAVLYVFVDRFTSDLLIAFETSDPATHLKNTMNMINNRAVSGMYIGQLINGMFIESLTNIFSGAFIYKSFILQYGINFFMAGYMFWAAMQGFCKNILMRILCFIVTLIYLFGYPYNDFLFGFVYLQMTVTMVCYLFATVQIFLSDNGNIYFYCALMSVGCLGVSIGYTLFAPAVYISVLCCIFYKAYQGKWLFREKRKIIFSNIFIKVALSVFLLPTILTIYFLIIKSSTKYISALNLEGYIYRNLYSDFLLYIVLATYGMIYSFKKRKINYFSFLYPVLSIYALYFLIQMLSDNVSTYYFYKFNFLTWLVVLGLFVVGLSEIMEEQKILSYCMIAYIGLLCIVQFSQFEITWNGKDSLYMPYTDAKAFFRIFSQNKICEERRSQIPEGLIEVCDIVNKNSLNMDEQPLFIANYTYFYWYEALTNQRFPKKYVQTSSKDLLEQYIYGMHGKTAIIEKDSKGLEKYQIFIDSYTVYENDYAYIIQFDGQENILADNDLSQITDVKEYLSALYEGRDRYCIFISVQDEASYGLNNDIIKEFRKFGLDMPLKDQYRASYLAVINGDYISEQIGYEKLTMTGTFDNDTVAYEIVSAGWNCGYISSILLNGEEYSRNQRGLNIVVYSTESKLIVDSITLDTGAKKITIAR